MRNEGRDNGSRRGTKHTECDAGDQNRQKDTRAEVGSGEQCRDEGNDKRRRVNPSQAAKKSASEEQFFDQRTESDSYKGHDDSSKVRIDAQHFELSSDIFLRRRPTTFEQPSDHLRRNLQRNAEAGCERVESYVSGANTKDIPDALRSAVDANDCVESDGISGSLATYAIDKIRGG
jgi:hypothetical protein